MNSSSEGDYEFVQDEESTHATTVEPVQGEKLKSLKEFKVSTGYGWIFLSLLSGLFFGVQPVILGEASVLGFDT